MLSNLAVGDRPHRANPRSGLAPWPRTGARDRSPVRAWRDLAFQFLFRIPITGEKISQHRSLWFSFS